MHSISKLVIKHDYGELTNDRKNYFNGPVIGVKALSELALIDCQRGINWHLLGRFFN